VVDADPHGRNAPAAAIVEPGAIAHWKSLVSFDEYEKLGVTVEAEIPGDAVIVVVGAVLGVVTGSTTNARSAEALPAFAKNR